MKKTIINTAKCQNDYTNGNNHKGCPIFVSRTKRIKGSQKIRWFREFAPTKEISEDIKNNCFDSYIKYLTKYCKTFSMLWIIAELTELKEVTLLCYCEKPERCHRMPLACWLIKKYPENFRLGELT